MAEKTTSFANIHGADWETKEISVYGAAKAFIKQLRVGMDLTHVSIPAIFLLPYSILEFIAVRMTAVFYVLLDAAKEEDPQKRIEGILRFIIGMGREEDLLLNHKPCNPILGEEHKARVDHDDGSYSYVLCEQTVHHPPTSAFEIHNPKHGVTLSGNMNFGVLFHSNSVTVETKGGLKVTYRLPDGTEEVYLMEAGVPDMLIKNVLLGTKYVYWTGSLHIKCPSSGYEAQMVFGYKDNKNTVNGVIWRSADKKTEEKKSKEKASWSKWAKGAVKSTAKFTTGWLGYYQDDENGWIQNIEPAFDPNNVLARFFGTGGNECWVYPGDFVIIDPKTEKPKPLAERERYLLVNPRELKPHECSVYPDFDKLPDNASLKVWRGVGEAIVNEEVENADIRKTEIEERQREKRKEFSDEDHKPVYFHLDETDWPFWAINNRNWFLEDPSGLCAE